MLVPFEKCVRRAVHGTAMVVGAATSRSLRLAAGVNSCNFNVTFPVTEGTHHSTGISSIQTFGERRFESTPVMGHALAVPFPSPTRWVVSYGTTNRMQGLHGFRRSRLGSARQLRQGRCLAQP